MLSVTHRLYAMKYWVIVVNTSHGKYCLQCMLRVDTDIYIYIYIYMPKHTMPMQRQKDIPCHCGNMHNMAGQQAKAQEKHFSRATGM